MTTTTETTAPTGTRTDSGPPSLDQMIRQAIADAPGSPAVRLAAAKVARRYGDLPVEALAETPQPVYDLLKDVGGLYGAFRDEGVNVDESGAQPAPEQTQAARREHRLASIAHGLIAEADRPSDPASREALSSLLYSKARDARIPLTMEDAHERIQAAIEYAVDGCVVPDANVAESGAQGTSKSLAEAVRFDARHSLKRAYAVASLIQGAGSIDDWNFDELSEIICDNLREAMDEIERLRNEEGQA